MLLQSVRTLTRTLKKMCSVAADVENMNKAVQSARSLTAEELDKQSRRCNIIIHKSPERPADNGEERNVHDKRYCMQPLNDLDVGLIEEDVKKIMRQGRFGASESPRPITIQFGNRNIKNLVMESLYKIKHQDSKFKSVIVTHDLTRKERQEL